MVVGADGLIGHALSSELGRRDHDVIRTTRRRAQGPHVDSLVFLDLAADRLAPVPPADVIVICAAMASFSDCRNRFDLAHRVNVEARLQLARTATENGGRVVALSSSAVFDCLRPRARADWRPAPRSAYGRLMAEAEVDILACGGAVLRSTKVMAAGFGVLANWITILRGGGAVRAFEDHSFCPLPLNDVVDAIIAIVEQQEGGIFQVSGGSDMSYANAARHIAGRVGVPRDRVTAIRAVDNGIPESDVTPFTSLETSRLSALTGFQPPQPDAVIDAVYQGILVGPRPALRLDQTDVMQRSTVPLPPWPAA
jgi:dTDP-4-dehydrorhamnose reductase